MKKTFKFTAILIVISLLLSGCDFFTKKNMLNLKNADIVVIESGQTTPNSYLASYSKEGKLLQRISVDMPALQGDGMLRTPQVIDGKAYGLSNGHKDSPSQKIMQLDMKTGYINIFDNVGSNMVSVTGNKDYVFGMDSSSTVKIKKETGERKSLEIPITAIKACCCKGKLCVMGFFANVKEGQEDSSKQDNCVYEAQIFVIDPNTDEIERIIEIPECGDFSNAVVLNDTIYIPTGTKHFGNYVVDDGNTKVIACNIDDSSIWTLDTGHVAPAYIEEYNDTLLVLSASDNSYKTEDKPKEYFITMIDKETHKVVVDKKFDYYPQGMKVRGDELYVPDQSEDTTHHDSGGQFMHIYSLPNLEFKRRFDISPKDDNDFINLGFCLVEKD